MLFKGRRKKVAVFIPACGVPVSTGTSDQHQCDLVSFNINVMIDHSSILYTSPSCLLIASDMETFPIKPNDDIDFDVFKIDWEHQTVLSPSQLCVVCRLQ